MAFGVTDSGFVIKRLVDILPEIKAAIWAATEWGSGANLEPDSPIGQLVGIFAEREALIWELAEAIYNAAYPQNAEGTALDNVCDIIGITRTPATYSTVELTLGGTPGTVITAGAVVSVEGSGERFLLDAPVTISGSGTVQGQFTAENSGEVRANAGTLNQVDTLIPGWTSATNADDATIGTAIETNAELRLRRLQSPQIIGASTVNSMQSRLRQQVDNVTDAVVIENDTDYTDAEGRPPHSVHCILSGGLDQDIADKIWETKAGGVGTHGSTTVTVTDSQGYEHDIKFDRAVDVNIWFLVQLTVTSAFDQGAKQKILVTVDEVNNNHLYTTTINVIVFSYTSSGAATDVEIAGGLVLAINTGSGASYVPVAATDVGDGTFYLEADYAGCPFECDVPDELSQANVTLNSGDQGAIIDAIVDYALEVQNIGVDVIRSRYFVPVNDASAETLSIEIKLGKTTAMPIPSGTSNIDILSSERASVDSTHIVVEIL
jgi:uncharacterized phage protein gp47/JayE